MLEEFLDQVVVLDFRAEYVCIGTLKKVGDHFLELRNADLHDLRDTDVTRENYIAASVATGLKRNRKKILITRAEIVAISRMNDVVDE